MTKNGTALVIRDDMDLMTLGNIMVRSGYFSDVKDASQAIIKILAGRELGFSALVSMAGIHIIRGRVTVGANLLAALIKRSSKYNYKIIKLDNAVCELAFFEEGEEAGISVFTIEDAKKAGCQNLDKFPRNMLFARALSNGVRWFAPDISNVPIYTPEEMGATVNDEGEIIDIAPEMSQEDYWTDEERQKCINRIKDLLNKLGREVIDFDTALEEMTNKQLADLRQDLRAELDQPRSRPQKVIEN